MPFYLLLSIYALLFGLLVGLLIRIVSWIVKYTVKLTVWIMRHLLVMLYKGLRCITVYLYNAISSRYKATEYEVKA